MVQENRLNRFIEAQNGVYESVLSELASGRKWGHWMWFIFPQISGLGMTEMSKIFSISSPAEALEYLEHPVLGTRLQECTKLVLDIKNKSAEEIFGSVDSMKFRSCMTLFNSCQNSTGIFQKSLTKYFKGKPDAATLKLLEHLE